MVVRAFMQWMAVSSVVAWLDLSQVEVYGWSKSHIEASFASQVADEEGEALALSDNGT